MEDDPELNMLVGPPDRPVGRRSFLRTAGLLAAAGVAGFAGGTVAGLGDDDKPAAAPGRGPLTLGNRRDERVLNIYNWNNDLDDRTIPLFQAQSNLRVNYDVYSSSNEDLLARMRAGPTEYDIIVPTSWFVPTYLKLGLIEPLRTDLMPNLTGRVTLLREVTDLIGCALIYLGHSPNSIKDSDLADVVKLVRSVRPKLKGFTTQGELRAHPNMQARISSYISYGTRCRWPSRCSPPGPDQAV
ncbi:MAG: PotD/PotF family extracellular solute-binding protein, partial [Actinomycetes bacterium]